MREHILQYFPETSGNTNNQKRENKSPRWKVLLWRAGLAAVLLGSSSSETRHQAIALEESVGKIVFVHDGIEETLDDSIVRKRPEGKISLTAYLSDEKRKASFEQYLDTLASSGLEIVGDAQTLELNQNCYGYAIHVARPELDLSSQVWLEETGAIKILTATNQRYEVTPDAISQLPTGQLEEGDIVVIAAKDNDEIFFLHATYVIQDKKGKLLLEGKDGEFFVLQGQLESTIQYFRAGLPQEMSTVLIVFRKK